MFHKMYLIDATIAENIAFGVRCNDINFSRVTESAKKAQISDFIEDRLGLQYCC